MRLAREEIDRVGLGTAPQRFAASTERQPNGCLLWIRPYRSAKHPQIRMSVGGENWVESARVLAFRMGVGRWPRWSLHRTCKEPSCVEWTHYVDVPPEDEGKFSRTRKLTHAQVREIRRLYRPGTRQPGVLAGLAAKFKVSWNAVYSVARYETYGEVR